MKQVSKKKKSRVLGNALMQIVTTNTKLSPFYNSIPVVQSRSEDTETNCTGYLHHFVCFILMSASISDMLSGILERSNLIRQWQCLLVLAVYSLALF